MAKKAKPENQYNYVRQLLQENCIMGMEHFQSGKAIYANEEDKEPCPYKCGSKECPVTKAKRGVKKK